MARPDADRATKTLDDPASSTIDGHDATATGLTILWHADLRRVGQRAVFTTRRVEVSRLEPVFRDARDTPDGPLADPYVSRTPLVFTLERGGVHLEGAAVLDGLPFEGARTLDPASIERGVLIALARRVLLLLHRVPVRRSELPAFGLVGDSLAIRRLRGDIARVARTEATVLVRGESGSGKELVARAVHDAGPRAAGPYRAINVAAVPPPVAASSFFGHQRGAFSGADRDRPGYFGESDGGTLFLDEIGELPVEMQPLLLRTLETGEVQPVGAPRARRVDVRVIAATDARLEEAVDRGAFARPLLHRLAALELWVPPLRRRIDDIPRLLVHALRRELVALGALERIEGETAAQRPWLDVDAVARMVAHDWPGNVRELFNLARQIAVAGHDRARVRAGHVAALDRLGARASMSSGPVSSAPPESTDAEDPLTEERVLAALRAAGWSVHAAAREMAVPKTTLYRFIEKARLLRKASEIPDDELRAVHGACDGDRDAMSDRLRVSTRALAFRLKELDPPL